MTNCSIVPFIALGAVAFALVGPGLGNLEPFDMEPYSPTHFNFERETSFPKTPPLLGDGETLTTLGPWFADSSGRILLLRGVNVGGATKM